MDAEFKQPENIELVPPDALISLSELKKRLELTPERLQEIKNQQEQLKLLNSRARLNRDEKRLLYAKQLQLHHEQTGDREGLAEAYAQQGEYRKAAELTVNDEAKRQYLEKAAAIEKDDTICKCDPYRTENGMRLPNHNTEAWGYSGKHMKVMPFIRCRNCGELNARPPLKHLEDLRQMRGEAVKTGREKPASEVFGVKK